MGAKNGKQNREVPKPYNVSVPNRQREVAKYNTNNNRDGNVKRRKYNEDFKKLDILGKGTFETVYKVKDKNDGKIYAVKKLPVKQNLMKYLKQEITINSLISHQHLVDCKLVWIEENETARSRNHFNSEDSDEDERNKAALC